MKTGLNIQKLGQNDDLNTTYIGPNGNNIKRGT